MTGADTIGTPSNIDKRDLRRCAVSRLLVRLYRWQPCRPLCTRLAMRWEGGQFSSATLRRILARYHGVEPGAYSYGEGLRPGAFPAGVIIGRYVSIAAHVRVFLRNHPLKDSHCTHSSATRPSTLCWRTTF